MNLHSIIQTVPFCLYISCPIYSFSRQRIPSKYGSGHGIVSV